MVVNTVTKMLVMKTAAPMANDTNTLWGNSPAAASFDTPNWVTNQGKLEAIHVPMPMINVCNTKP